jgi:malonyl-ACP decarboxylase
MALIISGLGVTSAVGQGKDAFAAALMEGRHAFSVMVRPGRQRQTSFLGAEIASLQLPASIPSRAVRTASFSAQAALATLSEAWHDARLDAIDPARIGLFVGGTNLQQRELVQTHEAYGERLDFLRPSYGMAFLDTDVCGLCSEVFGIRGFAYTVGGASASGHVAVLQALQAVQSGAVDVCIAVGALMDLSYFECQGLRALGAMGSDRFAGDPACACRPFDEARDGFIFGECCGAVVVERAGARDVDPYAVVSGWATVMDTNRNPDPSLDGEIAVIEKALAGAGWRAADVDYVNPHGSGSVIGDETELRALAACGLGHARINATKSIVGHGLSAAGTVEIAATLLQMKAARLHPTRNLDRPIADAAWVRETAEPHAMQHALNLSLGFGGINTAICLSKS